MGQSYPYAGEVVCQFFIHEILQRNNIFKELTAEIFVFIRAITTIILCITYKC